MPKRNMRGMYERPHFAVERLGFFAERLKDYELWIMDAGLVDC